MANESWASGADGPPSGGATPTTDLTLAQLIAAEASCAVGDTAFPIDAAYTLICRTAGAWSYRYPRAIPDVQPPTEAGWANMNGATRSFGGGQMRINIPKAAGVNYKGQIRSLPAAPWYAIVGMNTSGHTGEAGIGLKAAAGAPIVTFTEPSTGNANHQKYSNFTTFSGNYYAHVGGSPKIPWWHAFTDDGVNRKTWWSPDRQNWVELFSIVRTDHITPDQLWIGGYPAGTQFDLELDVFDYEDGAGGLP